MAETPARIEETLEWIGYADRDLRAAEILLGAERPLLENGPFNCQQAVEKWLKAFLISHGTAFPKIHDLKKIGSLCIQVAPDLVDLIESVADLTDFATVYRYPGTAAPIDTSEARVWLELTNRARSVVLSKMPAEVRQALT